MATAAGESCDLDASPEAFAKQPDLRAFSSRYKCPRLKEALSWAPNYRFGAALIWWAPPEKY